MKCLELSQRRFWASILTELCRVQKGRSLYRDRGSYQKERIGEPLYGDQPLLSITMAGNKFTSTPLVHLTPVNSPSIGFTSYSRKKCSFCAHLQQLYLFSCTSSVCLHASLTAAAAIILRRKDSQNQARMQR